MKRIHFSLKNPKKMNSLKVIKVLKEKKLLYFTPQDLHRIFGASNYAVSDFINRHVKSGLFTKIKNSLYILTETVPPKLVLANWIYRPSYISFETALSYYHIIPETIYTVFSAAPKASREYISLDTTFIYHRIKKELFFGYTVQKVNGFSFLIAEPEKAIADYLYFVHLRKKELSERIDLKKVKRKRTLDYVKKFSNKNIFELVERIYNQQTTH